MLASVDHGFVLLCNPKTATSALEKSYRQYSNFVVGRGSRWKHISWQEYRRAFGSYFDDLGCTTYAVVRHPVELLVSWWRFRQRPKIQNPSHPHHGNSTAGVPFEQFVAEWGSSSPPSRATIIEQRDVLCDDQGAPPPITYFEYEQLPGLTRQLNRHVGVDVTVRRVNESPPISITADIDAICELPAMRPHLDFYQAIVGEASCSRAESLQ